MRRRFRLGMVVLAIALMLGASTARASLITGGYCPGAGQPFAQFGDFRSYVFGTNGGLEAGSSGWTFAGDSSVVKGNESYFVHSRYDSHSLRLGSGASATTPPMCMGTSSTVIRFFVANAAPGTLRVQVVERNLLRTVIGVLGGTSLSGVSGWKPAPAAADLGSLLGALGVSSVQLRFTASGGAWQVD